MQMILFLTRFFAKAVFNKALFDKFEFYIFDVSGKSPYDGKFYKIFTEVVL